jgi:hypothetical protein
MVEGCNLAVCAEPPTLLTKADLMENRLMGIPAKLMSCPDKADLPVDFVRIPSNMVYEFKPNIPHCLFAKKIVAPIWIYNPLKRVVKSFRGDFPHLEKSVENSFF